MTKGQTLSIKEKIQIGIEIQITKPKFKYTYEAYREVMKKHKISEITCEQCLQLAMAYDMGKAEGWSDGYKARQEELDELNEKENQA